LAENITTLPKGARLLVVGHTETDTWRDVETQKKRTQDVVIVDAIGASLTYTTIHIESDTAIPEGDN